MSTLQNRKSLIRRGEPITLCGLVFYPIMMSDYELFNACKGALIIRQSSLPVRYISLDYIQALFAMDMDAANDPEGHIPGIFARALTFLATSLRIEADRFFRECEIFQESTPDGRSPLLSRIRINQNGDPVELTSAELSTLIRPLICQQNGLEIPDESENLDIIRSFDELKAVQGQGRKGLKVDIDDLIAFVSYKSGCTPPDIDRWTVKQFEERRRAIERDRYHLVYALGELSGLVKFEKGNPVPSMFFDALDDRLGTASLESVGKNIPGTGMKGPR